MGFLEPTPIEGQVTSGFVLIEIADSEITQHLANDYFGVLIEDDGMGLFGSPRELFYVAKADMPDGFSQEDFRAAVEAFEDTRNDPEASDRFNVLEENQQIGLTVNDAEPPQIQTLNLFVTELTTKNDAGQFIVGLENGQQLELTGDEIPNPADMRITHLSDTMQSAIVEFRLGDDIAQARANLADFQQGPQDIPGIQALPQVEPFDGGYQLPEEISALRDNDGAVQFLAPLTPDSLQAFASFEAVVQPAADQDFTPVPRP